MNYPRLVQNGIDLYRVKEMIGHKSIKTTVRYAHHYPESLRTAVVVLDSCYDFASMGQEARVPAVASGIESTVNLQATPLGAYRVLVSLSGLKT